MSRFFISRPIVAMVIAILTVIVGAVTIAILPIAQFPNIAPPEIQVLATYVGADALTLEQAVATPIEQQVNGVDNMNYMYSLNATGNSQTTLIANFDIKTDPNIDLILTQSRENQAASQLPAAVTNYGVTIRKSVTAPLMLVGLYSPRGTRDAKFLANYAYINLSDRSPARPVSANAGLWRGLRDEARLIRPIGEARITVTDIVAPSRHRTREPCQAAATRCPQEFTSRCLLGRLTSTDELAISS
jgi:HAE1 family hydrophobic/amphiphilic exporter-1